MRIYQATISTPSYRVTDYLYEVNARELVELAGAGSVTTFNMNKSIHGDFPVYNSIGLDVFEAGVWKSICIF
jgi:hypothetical protein